MDLEGLANIASNLHNRVAYPHSGETLQTYLSNHSPPSRTEEGRVHRKLGVDSPEELSPFEAGVGWGPNGHPDSGLRPFEFLLVSYYDFSR